MTRFVHKLSIIIYVLVVLIAIVALGYIGFSFYMLPIEDRFFDPSYELLKPSGFLGHGLGIIGTLLIFIGLFSYMARKRFKVFSRVGELKYWLEFHIFMCTLGPVLILFHTTFKFGGLVSVGFWSMVVVVASGVIGRFLYLQIPHSIEGRELSLREVQDMKEALDNDLMTKYHIDIYEVSALKKFKIKSILKARNISRKEYFEVKRLIFNEKRLGIELKRLESMQRIFKYWHVAHLPFALILLVVVVIHIAVALTFGYKWIF
jgi:hypothetical protein